MRRRSNELGFCLLVNKFLVSLAVKAGVRDCCRTPLRAWQVSLPCLRILPISKLLPSISGDDLFEPCQGTCESTSAYIPTLSIDARPFVVRVL